MAVDAQRLNTPGVTAAGADPAPAPVWLQRLSLGVLVVFCLYLGGIITVLPWWRDVWDRNPLLLHYPALRGVLLRGWARGLVSALGILDVWIGLSEVANYREYRREDP